MPVSRSLVIAVGGALGATCRWAIDAAIGPTDWPWALFVINVAGSFLLGLAMVHGPSPGRELVRLGAGVGFCGGLTTFSAFAVTAVHLLDDTRTASAIAFVVASVVLGAAALVAGMRLRHQTVKA